MVEHTCEYCKKTDSGVEVFDENMVVIGGRTYDSLHPKCLEQLEALEELDRLEELAEEK